MIELKNVSVVFGKNTHLEIIALDNAQVNFGTVDVLAKGFTTYVNRRGHLLRDAKIDWALGLMNDSDTISESWLYIQPSIISNRSRNSAGRYHFTNPG